MAFPYRKANILCRGSNILQDQQRPVSLVQILLILIIRWQHHPANMHCFTCLLSSCYIKISVVSQYRILMAIQYRKTQLFSFFFSRQLAPAVLHSDLLAVDAD